jgi:hypothetical protein
MLLLATWFSSWSVGIPSTSGWADETVDDDDDDDDDSLQELDAKFLTCMFCWLLPTPESCAEVVESRPGCGLLKLGNAAGGRSGLNGTVFGLYRFCGRGFPDSPSSTESSKKLSCPWRSEIRDGVSSSSSPYRTGARMLSRSLILLILTARRGGA